MDANSKGGVAVVPGPGTLPYARDQEEQRTAAVPKEPTPPTTDEKPRTTRTRRQIQMPRIGSILQAYGGIVFLLLIGGLLWLADGYFTLWFLRGWVPSVTRMGIGQWAIPILMTLGQLYFWPRKAKLAAMWEARGQSLDEPENAKLQRRYERTRKRLIAHILIFALITLFNVGTSAQGVYEWAGGRFINLFGGFTLPTAGTSLRIWATVGGIITGFGAEKFFSWAKAEMNEI